MRKTRRGHKKRRALRRKTQRGGNSFFYLLNHLRYHEYISKIGPYKPVATPNSGAEPSKFVRLWQSLTDGEKNYISNVIYPALYNFHLGVEVTPSGENIGNRIIFYSQEHLDLLAHAAGMSKQELLNILKTVQNLGTYNRDLIKIAFNAPAYEGPLETEEGQLVKATYLSLIEH